MLSDKTISIIKKANQIMFIFFLAFVFFGNITSFSILNKQFSVSFFISLISIPLCIFEIFILRKQEQTKSFLILGLLLVFLLLFLTISNFGMSLCLMPFYNGYHQTSPIRVALEEMIKYFYDGLVFLYIAYRILFVRKKYLIYLFYVLAIFSFIVCVLQTIAFFEPESFFAKAYDNFNFLGIFVKTSFLTKYKSNGFRLYGIASEPSLNCVFLVSFLLPFFIIQAKNNFKNRRILFCFDCALGFLTILCIYFTKASSVYVPFLVFAVILLIFLIISKKILTRTKIITIASFAAFIVLLFIIPKTRETILYYVSDKVLGTGSYSTMYRYSTIYNDFNILIRMPVFGCGDGLQGYFYFKNISGTWFANSSETVRSLNGDFGLLNGGAFIPSILSGFGIVGTLLIIGFAYPIFKRGYSLLQSFEKILFIASLGSTIVSLFVAIGIHRCFYVFLLMFIPFVGKNYSNVFVLRKTIKENYYSINI